MTTVIIGGGFAGQLLHTLVPTARILDWRTSPPPASSRALGPQYLWEPIPGLENEVFFVRTLVDGVNATEASIRAYKNKVGKEQDGGDWRAQFRPLMTGYTCRLPDAPVEYNRRVTFINRHARTLHLADQTVIPYELLISTIPLYALLTMLKWWPVDLAYRPIYVVTKDDLGHPLRDGDAIANPLDMIVNYVSDPGSSIYRETLRDGQVHTESLIRPSHHNVSRILPGKIYACDTVPEILQDLAGSGIFTFGRFASWRPDELAHETYQRCASWQASGYQEVR